MNPPFFDRVRYLFGRDSATKKADDGSGCLPPVPGYPSGWGDCCTPSNLGGLTNYYTGMGTPRDQVPQSFYNYPRSFGKWELENAYRSSWIANRIVALPPQDMTREWRKFTIGGDDDGAMVRAVEDAEKALQVKKRCNLALKWARLYGGSLIFLGIRDQNPADKLEIESIRQGDLEWLLVLDRWSVQVETRDYVYDISDPNFGMPEFYQIQGNGQIWHNSRVIRFDGEELPLSVWQQNQRWSDSVLTHVLQVLIGLESAQRACLLAMQQGSLDVISLPNMRQYIGMAANGMAQIHNRVRVFSDLKSIYRAAVKDSDERFERVAPSLAGYAPLFDKWQDEVCGASQIPHTVLYGQSPAGLRATGDYDTRQYYDRISGLQENDLRPQLDYLDQVLIRSALDDMPADYSFDFKPLWQIDENSSSQIQYRNAQRDDIYVKNGVLEPEMVARQLLNDGTYSTLTGDDVNLIASYNEPFSQAEPQSPSTPEAVPDQPEMTTPGLPTGAPTKERGLSREYWPEAEYLEQ